MCGLCHDSGSGVAASGWEDAKPEQEASATDPVVERQQVDLAEADPRGHRIREMDRIERPDAIVRK